MASGTREQRIVAAVQCPLCNAWKGSPCFINGKPGRSVHGPAVHPERRLAWQEWKRANEVKNTNKTEGK